MLKIKEFLNKIEVDEFARPNGVIAINKPVGVTSHDIVDEVRRKFKTKRVGHAGALDPFATGVLLILVGKFTKLSEKLILENKEYKARILFGISTDTQDPEGKILKVQEIKIDKRKIIDVIESFEGGYEQYVPIFSSVKVEGNKLRKLARSSESFEVVEDKDSKKAVFKNKSKEIIVEIPKKPVEIEKIEILKIDSLDSDELKFSEEKVEPGKKFLFADVLMTVSKGTYIRQFAEDVGGKLSIPSMLIALERTKVGEISINDCVEVGDLSLDEAK